MAIATHRAIAIAIYLFFDKLSWSALAYQVETRLHQLWTTMISIHIAFQYALSNGAGHHLSS